MKHRLKCNSFCFILFFGLLTPLVRLDLACVQNAQGHTGAV